MNLDEYVRAYRRQLHPSLLRHAHEIQEHEALTVAAAQSEAMHGVGATVGNPALLHVSALAVISAYRPRVYTLRPAASKTVVATDLRTLPDAAPEILASPGILEARRPEVGHRLWGDVTSLGWYPYQGRLYLVGLTYPDGIAATAWSPQWHGGEIGDGAPVEVVGDREKHDEFLDSAIRFAITLGLLITAERSPIRVVRDVEARTVEVYAGEHPRPPPPDPGTRGDGERLGQLPGLEAWPVRVTGHLKRQPHGPGRTNRKWTYVEGYEARRWCDPRYRAERRSDWRPWKGRKSQGEHLGLTNEGEDE